MFNKRLREVRMKRGFTQQSTADLLDIALRTYQHYEEGTRSPSLESLSKIGDIFNISIDYLLGRDDYLKSLGVSFDGF